MKKNISFHVHYFPRVFLSVYFCFACQICAHARFFWKIKTNASCLYSYSYSLWQFSLNTLTRHIFKKLKQVPNSMKLRKEKEDNIASICSQLDQLFQKKNRGGEVQDIAIFKKKLRNFTLHITHKKTLHLLESLDDKQSLAGKQQVSREVYFLSQTLNFLPAMPSNSPA